MKMLSKILVLFCSFAFVHLFTSPVRAASEFTTDFSSIYEIREDGTTSVIHNISITNNLAHIYTTEYAILIGSTDLQDITAELSGVSLPTQVKTTDQSTTIKVVISDPQVGQGKVTSIRLSYTTGSITSHVGDNWEINIPSIAKANEYHSYTRDIHVPLSWGGELASFPKATSNQPGIYTYLGYPTDGISLLFGASQTYYLTLSYEIKNPTLTTQFTEIALPPDTAYQRVELDSLTPSPTKIALDDSGNWMAQYSLKSQEKLTVTAKLYVTVSPLPVYPLTLPVTGFTNPSDFWETKDPVIVQLSSKLQTPKSVYDYLVDNLTYDYSRISSGERLGAKHALENPDSAICTEYTDSFVAIMRAKGVATREINGYAYTNDTNLKPLGSGDVLHAWPEYYDESSSTWLELDPTWGRTTGGINYLDKLDYGHIAFVIHGKEPSYPLPAGAYKSSPDQKTITVEAVKAKKLPDPAYKITDEKNHYLIENTGKTAIHDLVIKLPSGESYTINYLPPHSSESSSVLLGQGNLFQKLYRWVLHTLHLDR